MTHLVWVADNFREVMRMRQIVAMGGGGFSMEPDNLLLDHYVLDICGKSRPKVCFLPTASGDSSDYIARFYEAFASLECVPSHLVLSRPDSNDLESYILDKDVIYVGGGNTARMLTLWHESGLDQVLRTAWHQGVVLAGLSAGAICWFEEGITDSFGRQLDRLSCLGFLPGSSCPYYDGEAERRPAYHRLLENGIVGPGLAVDDGAALYFEDTQLKEVVSSRRELSAENGCVIEKPLVTRYLG